MSSSQPRSGQAHPVVRVTLGMVIIILLAAFAFTCLSCGSDEANEPREKKDTQEQSQEENAQSLGRIMSHRNQLEGELNEPIDAVISGDITAIAETGEEIWLLIKVVDFRPTSVSQDALRAMPASELVVRIRITEDAGSLSTGDSVEINAMVSKSLEGPVIIGRAYRVIE